MNALETKLEYKICETKENALPVIIVAAGSSSRMQGVNKQLLKLGGMPVIIRTVRAFENSPDISRIILVVRDEDLFYIQMLCEKYSVKKLTDIVCGGKNRQESVLKGFSRLAEGEKSVLIHDGARPFVSQKIIQEVSLKLEEYPAVTCGVKITDTVKKINGNNEIVETLNREELIRVQTPQGVRIKDYLEAVERLKDRVSDFTDDCSVMESAGYKVAFAEGSYQNIKITTPEDIALSQGLLEGEEEI